MQKWIICKKISCYKRNLAYRGSRIIAPRIINPQITTLRTTAPGQLSPRKNVPRTIAPQDNWPPDNCPQAVSLSLLPQIILSSKIRCKSFTKNVSSFWFEEIEQIICSTWEHFFHSFIWLTTVYENLTIYF